jgi:hypothetical protein
MRRIAPLLLATLALAPVSHAQAPSDDVSAFVAGVVRAYGGRAALGRAKAYRMEGSVFSSMRHVTVPTVRVWASPDRFKSLVAYDEGAEARVVDGSSVWSNSPGGPLAPAESAMRLAAMLQSARAGLPWLLAGHVAGARMLPGEPAPVEPIVEGDGPAPRLVGIEVPVTEGLLLRAWADSTGLVRVSQGLLTHGPVVTHFETAYGDFHTVKGVPFAYREINWASGMRTGETTITRVVVNPELDRDEFHPPAVPDSVRLRRRGS